jgi:hypothetical protein
LIRLGTIMTTDVISTHQYGNWQFSLKSLMFVTTLVAIGAALVGISMVLAVLLVPLIIAGLVRTIRVAAHHEKIGSAKPALFATFCNSVALVVATIAVGLATMVVAAMAATLATLMLAVHVLRAARPIYQPLKRRLWQFIGAAGSMVVATVSRIRPILILRCLQVQAVARTLSLVAISRRLCRQCWCGTTNGRGEVHTS